MRPSSTSPVHALAAIAALFVASGCLLDRAGGLSATPRDGGGMRDAQVSPDAASPADGGHATDAGDACVPRSESCDGTDEDCDGTIDEALRALCETACGEGFDFCVDGAWQCSVPSPTEEQCNALDDDCDGSIDESLSRGCATACGVGVEACLGGAWGECVQTMSADERCDGIDQDCDAQIDEGLTRPCGAACGSGVETCSAGAWSSCGATGATAETCNGRDDDCDDAIDEEAGCPCGRVAQDGRVYLFCTGARTWPEGRAFCLARGYDLVTIGSADENALVEGQAHARILTDWWIGLHDRDEEGSFVWADGDAASYRNFSEAQPNQAGDQDCVSLDDGDEPYEARGAWGDRSCADVSPFVCETGP